MPKVDEQRGLWDRTIEDLEFEDALEEMELTRAQHKRFAKAKKNIALKCEEHHLQPGERLRVGRFVIPGVERAGGGFEVPKWESVVAGRPEKLS